MATPLKLRSERVGKLPLAQNLPYLGVLVDTGVFHLDQIFDYTLPEKFDLKPGKWVSVPFKGENRRGLIVERRAKSAITSKLLPINREIQGPFLTREFMELYQSIAKRWAVPIFDVLRFVLRFKSSETGENSKSDISKVKTNAKRVYRQFSSAKDEISEAVQILKEVSKTGSTLFIVPEKRTAEYFLQELKRENLLDKVTLGMRSVALTPISFVNIVVLREDSEHHYELKSPGFNSRDIALLRNQILGENLLFIGYSPSLEMNRLIDNGFISLKRAQSKINVLAKPSEQGELIPTGLISPFKQALSIGSVLVIVPSKGYGFAISCASCRNIAKCSCGGKLTKYSRSENPKCVICSKDFPDWHCKYCGKNRIYLIGKGIERIAEEFGRTFNNSKIHFATADKELLGEVGKRSIVLATVGSAPNLKFTATLFLEGLNLNSDMRAEERYLSMLFKYTALSAGNSLVVQGSENPMINALIRWQPFTIMNRINEELKVAKLPPFTRHILIKCEKEERDRIYAGLLTSIKDDRIPKGSKIYSLEDGVISIFFDLRSAAKVLAFIYEFQKRRSMSGKAPLKMRIDPYQFG